MSEDTTKPNSEEASESKNDEPSAAASTELDIDQKNIEDAQSDQEDKKEEKPKKPPRKLRLFAVILLPLLVIGLMLGLWLGGDALLEQQLRKILGLWHLDPAETKITTEFTGGKVALTDVTLLAHHEDETRQVYTSPDTNFDIDMWASYTKGEIIINSLVMKDVSVDLRKFKDGKTPGYHVEEQEVVRENEKAQETPMETKEEKTAPAEPTHAIKEEKSEIDKLKEKKEEFQEEFAYYKDWYDTIREWLPSNEEEEETEAQNRPAPGWTRARRFYPATSGAWAFPRTVIKKLELSGNEFLGPNSQKSANNDDPADFTFFSINGEDVAARLLEDEKMLLNGQYETLGLGAGTFAWSRSTSNGDFSLKWLNIDLNTYSNSKAGSGLKKYGAQGKADLALTANWQSDKLDGQLSIVLTNLRLKPAADANKKVKTIAEALDKIYELQDKIDNKETVTLTWILKIGGTPSRPRIIDFGFDSLLASIKDIGKKLLNKEAIIDAGTKLAQEEIDNAKAKAQAEIDKAKAQAQQEIDKAKAEAEALKAKAQAEAEKAKAQAEAAKAKAEAEVAKAKAEAEKAKREAEAKAKAEAEKAKQKIEEEKRRAQEKIEAEKRKAEEEAKKKLEEEAKRGLKKLFGN